MALRLRVYVSRRKLDRQIGAARERESTAMLALRERQLVHPRTLQQVVRNLRETVEYVDRLGSRRVLSTVVTDRAAVRAGREAILGLADRIEAAGPVSPRGIALAWTFLTDGLSPLYNPSSERTVIELVWEIADALEPVFTQPL